MRHLCRQCGQHPALARVPWTHGRKHRVKAMRGHDLCDRCYRSEASKVKAAALRQGEN